MCNLKTHRKADSVARIHAKLDSRIKTQVQCKYEYLHKQGHIVEMLKEKMAYSQVRQLTGWQCLQQYFATECLRALYLKWLDELAAPV